MLKFRYVFEVSKGKSRVFFGYHTQIYFWTLVCQYKLCSLLPAGDSPNPKSKQEVRWIGSRQLPAACVELSLCCNLVVTLWLLSIVWFIITKRTWSCRKKAAVATGCPTLGGWEEQAGDVSQSFYTLPTYWPFKPVRQISMWGPRGFEELGKWNHWSQ